MERIFTIVIQQIMLLALIGVCVSCIKEGLDECPTPPDPNPDLCEVRLSFDYPHKDEESGVGFDPNEVRFIQIYVFDEDNKYINTFTDEDPLLSDKDYFSTVTLETGIYNFIVYGNLKDSYSIEPELLKDGMSPDAISYYYNEVVDDTITTHPKHLFYSSLHDIVISKSIDHFILPLVRNTYEINLTVEGLPETFDGYQFTITDTNWKYQFDNTILPCTEVNYVQDCNLDTLINQYTATFTTLRLNKSRNPQLKLYSKSSGELLYRDELIPLILKIEEQNIEVDFSKIYEFNIHLLFDRDPVTGNLTVDISINGWSIIEKEVIIELD